jgi:PAS domain S-box-containing protein
VLFKKKLSASEPSLFGPGEESTELARSVVDALFAFVAVLRYDGTLLEANAAPLKAAGIRLDQVRGKKLWDCYWWNYSPEVSDRVREACREACAGHKARLDLVARGRDDARVLVDFQVAPIGNETTPKYLVASGVDITKRKSAEDALVERDRRKDAFMSVLAHELRNPLAPVRNALAILRRTLGPDPRAHHAADVIDRQVNHLVGLVDDLLDVARVNSGRLQLNAQLCDMCALAVQTAEDYRPTLEAAGCSLTIHRADQPVLVYADPVRLGQMMRNYLQNAQRFASGSAVTVQCGVDAAANSGVLTVADTGPGFTPELGERLFEPFPQAEQELGGRQGGMGLGLALTKGLAHLQGGTVAARSAGAGKGATFEIRLPLASDRLRPVEPQVASKIHTGGSHVLIVEDHEDTADTLQELLRAHGYAVVMAHDAPTGLAMARTWRPEVVISDIGLPGMNGYEFAQALRSTPDLAETLLVAVSGYADVEARRLSKAAGFDVHFAKPVAPGELLKVLEEALPS